MGVLRSFLELNKRISYSIDHLISAAGDREDGNKFFLNEIVPNSIGHSDTVYELGGGSQPCVSLAQKKEMGVRLVGLDISAAELDAAPAGVYDKKIVTDLCHYVGESDADVVICQATLEHVPDATGAVRAMASCAKPGGHICIFAPSRNALFARINLFLPESWKRRLLYSLFPHKAEGHDGFEAHYDHCTPKEIEKLALDSGLSIEQRHLFWISSYFTIFVPVFVLWRIYQKCARAIYKDNAAETFVYVLRKIE